jgi:hypothetical protein
MKAVLRSLKKIGKIVKWSDGAEGLRVASAGSDGPSFSPGRSRAYGIGDPTGPVE